MNKETQKIAWNCLPKEFKEEVKRVANIFSRRTSGMLGGERTLADTFLNEFINLFGRHNLTSDAEGEEDEMRYVIRKQIDALQGEIFKAIMDAHDADDGQDAAHYIFEVMLRSFAALFGSKCLPDDLPEDNFAKSETKYKVGDEVVWDKRIIAKVDKILNDGDYIIYSRVGNRYTVHESDLESYTEPEEEYRNLSQETANCDKEFDNILKDGFAQERRLNIAAQFMSAMISNPSVFYHRLNDEDEDFIIYGSLEFADALIAEAEKGGSKRATTT